MICNNGGGLLGIKITIIVKALSIQVVLAWPLYKVQLPHLILDALLDVYDPLC